MLGHSALSPAEALLLLDPEKTRPREALKVSLMALLAQRKLQIDEHAGKGFLGRRTSTTRLSANASNGREAPHETSLLQIVRASQPVTMDDFVADAKRSYGQDFSGFTKQYVAPALIGRGLLREAIEPFLFFFKRRRLRPTAAGDIERARLEGLMAQARDIPSFLDSDPKKAAAMAIALGGLVLLLPGLQPHLAQLGDVIRHHGQQASNDSSSSSSDSSTSFSSSTSSPDAPQNLSPGAEQLDLGSFDWGSFDSASLDAVSASMETLDASFDSSSSDSSSSDGGGGDSGGGGDGGGGGGD